MNVLVTTAAHICFVLMVLYGVFKLEMWLWPENLYVNLFFAALLAVRAAWNVAQAIESSPKTNHD